MTIPRPLAVAAQRVSDWVREALPKARFRITPNESALSVHLRANPALYDDLTKFLRSRIEGRAAVPEPNDPLVAKSMVARDREVQWILARLDFLKNAPLSHPGEGHGEQPS